MAYIFIPHLGSLNKRAFVTMGFMWMLATFVFETAMGLVLGQSPAEMLHNYDISNGNLWVFIVIFIGFVPSVVAKLKSLE